MLSGLPEDRFRSMKRADPVELVSPSAAVSHPFRRFRFIIAALTVALITALVSATLYILCNPEEKTAIRFEIPAPGIYGVFPPAISPYGQYVAYLARADGKGAIWIRPIGEVRARPLPGTENGMGPFWSPDSRYLAFFGDGKLKKISIDGGSATTLTNAAGLTPGAWRTAMASFSSLGGSPGAYSASRNREAQR